MPHNRATQITPLREIRYGPRGELVAHTRRPAGQEHAFVTAVRCGVVYRVIGRYDTFDGAAAARTRRPDLRILPLHRGTGEEGA